MNEIETHEQRLERLGMKSAADKIKKAKDLKRKLAIAYEHFRFVKQEKIDAFNSKLREERLPSGGYKILSFTSLGNYNEVPPPAVLEALEHAQEFKCFDSFEIAHIVEVRDPILFGRIEDCPDRFYVAQWDDDVKIEDILKENEG